MNRPSRISISFSAMLAFAVAVGCARAPVRTATESASPAAEAKGSVVERAASKGDSVKRDGVERQYAEAIAALRQNRDSDAERGFLAITRAQPDYAGPYANLAIVYKKQGRLQDAERMISDAITRGPKRAEFHNMLGVVRRMQGNMQGAAQAYEQALTLDENLADAHYNLGILYDLYLNDYAKAAGHYQRYLALVNGGDKDVRLWLDELAKRMSAGGR